MYGVQLLLAVITQHMQINVYDYLSLAKGSMQKHLREEPRKPDFCTTNGSFDKSNMLLKSLKQLYNSKSITASPSIMNTTHWLVFNKSAKQAKKCGD